MRDVRGVFAGFFAARRRRGGRAWSCSSPARGGWAIPSGPGPRSRPGCAALDRRGRRRRRDRVRSRSTQLFELFHRLFFPAGSFTFDPRTDRLVQLFPFDFWSETTIVLGVVIVVLAALVWLVARRLAAAAARRRTTPRQRSPPPRRADRRPPGERRADRPDPRVRDPPPPLVAVHRRDRHRHRRRPPRRLPAGDLDPPLTWVDRAGRLDRVHADGDRPRAGPRRRRPPRRGAEARCSSSTSSARRRRSTSIASSPRAEAAIAVAGPLASLRPRRPRRRRSPSDRCPSARLAGPIADVLHRSSGRST